MAVTRSKATLKPLIDWEEQKDVKEQTRSAVQLEQAKKGWKYFEKRKELDQDEEERVGKAADLFQKLMETPTKFNFGSVIVSDANF